MYISFATAQIEPFLSVQEHQLNNVILSLLVCLSSCNALKGLQTSLQTRKLDDVTLRMYSPYHWTASPFTKDDFHLFHALWWNIVTRKLRPHIVFGSEFQGSACRGNGSLNSFSQSAGTRPTFNAWKKVWIALVFSGAGEILQ